MKYFQLTNPSKLDFAESIASVINQDYPEIATIREHKGGYIVLVDLNYYESCKRYVARHCKIREENRK